ncbi:MAG: hypothetical protein QG556_524 [Pseudomonadota bacterium]|nr:hypothetical protein [Pseudomonadota bacterium]
MMFKSGILKISLLYMFEQFFDYLTKNDFFQYILVFLKPCSMRVVLESLLYLDVFE